VWGGRISRCGLGLFGCRRFRVSRHSSRPPVLPSFPPTAVLPSFPHASGGNPFGSCREALSMLVVLCTIGGAGSPTKTLGDDGDGVCWDEGDGVRGDAAMSCFCFNLFLNQARSPGVARLPLTFFASPKNVSKKRRPRCRCPAGSRQSNSASGE
jgi:hypothetical protein